MLNVSKCFKTGESRNKTSSTLQRCRRTNQGPLQADDLLFCYRWLLLELKREFAFDDALHMLEVLWSSLPPDPPEETLPLFEVNVRLYINVYHHGNSQILSVPACSSTLYNRHRLLTQA